MPRHGAAHLSAERDGRDFRIDPAELAPLIEQLADADSDTAAAESDVSDQVPHPAAALSDGLSERIKLLEMLDERDRTIMELAGRVGYYQAETEQLRTRLTALEAPKGEVGLSTNVVENPQRGSFEEGGRPPADPAPRRWWQRLGFG
jgi:hypothetical protein